MAKSIRKIITSAQQAGTDFKIQGHNEACFYALERISDEIYARGVHKQTAAHRYKSAPGIRARERENARACTYAECDNARESLGPEIP